MVFLLQDYLVLRCDKQEGSRKKILALLQSYFNDEKEEVFLAMVRTGLKFT